MALSCVSGLFVFVYILQALHFFIGFGALVSPLIADPFLSEHGCGNHTENGTEIMHHFRNMLRNSPIAEHNITLSGGGGVEEEEESIVHYAFWIMALINVRTTLIKPRFRNVLNVNLFFLSLSSSKDKCV